MSDLSFSMLMTLSVMFGLSAGMQIFTPFMSIKTAKQTHFYAAIIAALGVCIALSHWLQSVV